MKYFKQQNVMDFISRHKDDKLVHNELINEELVHNKDDKHNKDNKHNKRKKGGAPNKQNNNIIFFHLNKQNNIPGYITIALVSDNNLLFSLDPIIKHLKKKYANEINIVDDADMVKKFIEIPDYLKKKIITIEVHHDIEDKHLEEIAKFIFDHIKKQTWIYN